MNTDSIARTLFGQTYGEAIAAGTCIRCKLSVAEMPLTGEDKAEYRVTAICPTCWVAMFPEDDPRVESHT